MRTFVYTLDANGNMKLLGSFRRHRKAERFVDSLAIDGVFLTARISIKKLTEKE